MSEPKMISPLLDHFAVGGLISEHDGVCCYPAINKDTQEKYILKIVSIPASQIRLQALLTTGAYKSETEAFEYFSALAKELTQEVSVLSKLASLEGFLPYESCQIVRKTDGVGLDVYLLGSYRRSLQRHLKKNTMTHLAAINLGFDLCACMALCRQSGYLYVDLKPSNIYMLDDKTFRIGDLGFMDIKHLKYASIPERYLSEYTAPEITDALSDLNTTIDIYSIGLILYQIYNGGVLPTDLSTPPEYADYELAEIIMKACDPLPANRWQDPVQMGQALKSYMQRNVVNDDPIVPPVVPLDSDEVVPFEEEDDSDDPQVLFEQVDEAGQLMIEEMIDYDHAPVASGIDGAENKGMPNGTEGSEEGDEDPTNLSFLDILVNDETAPGEDTVVGVGYNELSDETSSILSMADDLIAMEVPPPVVAHEASEIPGPVNDADAEELAGPEGEEESGVPVMTGNNDTETENAGNTEYTGDETIAVVINPEESDNTDSEIGAAETEEDGNADAMTGSETKVIPAPVLDPPGTNTSEDTEDDTIEEETTTGKGILSKVLAFILAGLIIICLIVGGMIFYRDYYLKTVHNLVLDGFEDRLDVIISSNADDELLTVVCTDTYGNRQTSPVVNGIASFGGLNADTLYTVTLEIEGFHALAGNTSNSYTTSPRTEIATFSAITGVNPGSVILSFTIKGQDSDEWTVKYSTEGEAPKSTTFTGHMISIEDLTIGKTYTFTLESTDDLFVYGNNSIEHLASDLIYAEDLVIDQCNDQGLQVKWKAPADSNVASWTVVCYNNSGYSETLTTSETSALFTGIDPDSGYTVEVSAYGMSVSNRCYVSENSVTVSNISTNVSSTALEITWNYSGTAPSSQWVILYSYNDSEHQEILRSDATSVKISPVVPGVTYNVTIALEDGTSVFSGTTSATIPEATDFTGYLVSKKDMTFRMCVAPNVQDWTWRNVTTYKDTFGTSEKAGFVMHLRERYATSPNIITTLYVTRNDAGEIVNVSHTSQSWTSMWYQSYGELTVPSLPTEAGSYTIDLYFNGQHVHTHSFTIK